MWVQLSELYTCQMIELCAYFTSILDSTFLSPLMLQRQFQAECRLDTGIHLCLRAVLAQMGSALLEKTGFRCQQLEHEALLEAVQERRHW